MNTEIEKSIAALVDYVLEHEGESYYEFMGIDPADTDAVLWAAQTDHIYTHAVRVSKASASDKLTDLESRLLAALKHSLNQINHSYRTTNFRLIESAIDKAEGHS